MPEATQPPQLVRRGYRYRIYPTAEQQQYLAVNFGCARYVYNAMLAEATTAYNRHGEAVQLHNQQHIDLLVAAGMDELDAASAVPSYDGTAPSVHTNHFANQISKMRKHPDTPWLADASAVALQQAARDLGSAYSHYFQRIKAAKSGPLPGLKAALQSKPRYRSRKRKQSIRLPVGEFSLRDQLLRLPKLPDGIKVVWSRELPSAPSQVTVSKDTDGAYYATFLCARELRPTNGLGITGIDVGIHVLMTTSTTDASGVSTAEILNTRRMAASASRLAILQRKLARCKLGSNRFHRQRSRVASLHQHVRNQRTAYLHHWTSQLIRENQAICVESLQVQQMMQSHLAGLIADASWATITQMLRYKAEDSAWCTIVVAPPYYPSTQLCSSCSNKASPPVQLGINSWQCSCGATHNRDINAAHNLRQLAIQSRALWAMQPGATVQLNLHSR